MTREQESDSTLSPEKEERGMVIASPRRMGEEENNLNPPYSGSITHLAMSPRGTICSFCGISTNGYRDCPIMHQYIRE